jgi:hypothetical protein
MSCNDCFSTEVRQSGRYSSVPKTGTMLETDGGVPRVGTVVLLLGRSPPMVSCPLGLEIAPRATDFTDALKGEVRP